MFLCPQANAIGRSAKTVREFLEKHYTEEVADSDDETIKLAIKALLEVGNCRKTVFGAINRKIRCTAHLFLFLKVC